MPDDIIDATFQMDLTASATLQAAKGDALPKLNIVANTGAPMRLDGYPHPVVIDIAGIVFAKESLAIIADHDPRKRIGHSTENRTTESEILLSGVVSGAGPIATEFATESKRGFPHEASVDALVLERDFIRAGESSTVNGRTLEGPLIISRKTLLKGVSIVTWGADSGTSSIAANRKGTAKMDGTETNEQTPEQIERTRVSGITKLTAQYVKEAPEESKIGEIAATAIDEGWDTHRAELEMLRAGRPVGPTNVHTLRGGSPKTANILEASLMLRAGQSELALKHFDEQTVEAASRSGINSQVDLMRAALSMQHIEIPNTTEEIVKAAFSTTSLPNILSNVMGKTLAAAYSEATEDIFKVATVKTASTFHAQKTIRPSSIETTEAIGKDGEIKHSSIEEEDTYAWQLGTFGRMVSVTRKDIVNDDLSFFDELPQMLAVASARKLLDLFWSVILAGETGAHYSSGNGNLLEAGSDLDITSLSLAIQTFRSQRDSQGNNISIKPRALIVPPDLEQIARPLLNSSEIVTGSDVTKPNGNPVQGAVQDLIVEARMSNSDKFSGASAAAWYLFGGPMSHAVLVGFLNGRRSPNVEVEQAPFNTLGIQMRVYHDFACALGDPKASLKATGASTG